MKDIVKGNDINILWDIVRKINGQDEPYDLTGRNLSLYLVTPLGQEVIDDFTTQGNTIIWTFQGMDQKVLGVYSLKLVINESQPYMQTVDECNVLRLVEHSCMAGGHDDEGIKVETISLIAHIDVAAIIPDTSLNANSQNVVTNAAITQGLGAMHKELSQDIESSAAVINNEVKAVRQELSTINASKANTLGRYPDMSVGFADDLVGRGESVPAEFSFRASGGKSIRDGAARIKRLKGNSVVWNQWVDTIVPQDCDLSETDNRLTITPQGAFPGVFNATTMNLIVNHVYICISHRIDGGFLKVNCGGYDSYTNVPFRTTYGHYGFTIYSYGETQPFTITRPILIDLTKMFGAGNEPTTIEEYEARKPIVADEYAYNEGEVIHMTAEGIKSVGDNAWDEEWELGYINPGNGNESDSSSYIRSKNYCRIIGGEEYFLKNTTGGDGTDANMFIVLYDENHSYLDYWGIPESGRTIQFDSRAQYFKVSFRDTYGTTYKNDVMISLMHSGWKADTDAGYQPYWEDTLPLPIILKYFPDGMKKAGTAHDEIRYNKASGKWEYSKGKIKSVDMGSLSWEKAWYNEADKWRIYAEFRQKATGFSNMINRIYPNANTGDGSMADKTITGHDNPDLPYIYLKDSSYSAEGADALIASLQGVMLYYESNDWEWVELDAEDQNFNLDYKVADFGTEEIISAQPSAPISADIIYQFNAVDMIREHELEITELQRIIATMQAQLAQMQMLE